MANNPISQSPDSPIAAFEKRLPAEIGTGAFSRSDFNNGFGVGSVMGSFPKKDLYLPACQIASKCDPLFAAKNDPFDGAETGGAEPHIAEQSRSWRAASGGRAVMRGS